MNPISNTAFYTCAIRAADAAQPQSIGKDIYAHLFMNEKGKAVAAKTKAPRKSTVGVVVRHRLIDDLLRKQLSLHPDTVVIDIGCGFDTRSFRISGGQWYEIDEPQVVDLKNANLPVADCINPLERISIDFSEERLESRLPKIPGSVPVVVVIEGVFYYLNTEQFDTTLRALRGAYPAHTLICDLIDRQMAEKYSKEAQQDLEILGARWIFTPDEPVLAFERAGYRTRISISIVEKILEFEKRSRVIHLLLRLLAPGLLKGMCVYVFERNEG